MKKFLPYLTLISLLLLVTGCSAPKTSVTVPNFKKEYQVKKNIIVVPPKVKMYEISAAGEEEIIEWSNTAKRNMLASLEKEMNNQNFLSHTSLNLSTLSEENKELIDNSNNLIYRISPSINSHALESSFIKFDEKIGNFDYTIGDTLSNISKEGDLYLFINAFDKVQSSGKVAVETAKLIVGALLGIAAGDFGGITYSSIALVDGKTGKILWYNYYVSKGQVDLREELGTDAVVKALLNDLQNNI